MNTETLIPKLGVVTDIRIDTPDVKTFRVVGLDGKKVFEHMPGQCAMLSIPGVGEAMFSITSSPTNEDFMEFSIKKCGCLTNWLHAMDVGQQITIRGPYARSSTTCGINVRTMAASRSSMVPAPTRTWWITRRFWTSGWRTRVSKST